jgi:hypothetical protein
MRHGAHRVEGPRLIGCAFHPRGGRLPVQVCCTSPLHVLLAHRLQGISGSAVNDLDVGRIDGSVAIPQPTPILPTNSRTLSTTDH